MLLPFDSIARTIDFDQRASVMQLRPWQWEFLLAADGHTRLGDLARSCGVDFDTACDLVHETEGLGLVEIVTLTLDAYRASVAQRVTPLASPSTVTFTAAAFAQPSPVLETEMPVAIAAPRKMVSLSFDSFDSFPSIDSTPSKDPDLERSDAAHGSSLTEHPSIGEIPIAFEIPNHMEPLGDRDVTFEPHLADRYDDLFAPIAAPAHEDVSSTNGSVRNGVAHDLFAHESLSHEPTAHGDPLLDNAHDFPAFDASVNAAPAHDAMPHEPPVPEHVAPLVFSAEPEPAKKSVSFSLSSDSFGLPTEPYDTTGFDAESELTSLLEPAHASDPNLPKKDDVLLSHFQVEGAHVPDGTYGASAEDPIADMRANGDLTGVVLRVLGLKK